MSNATQQEKVQAITGASIAAVGFDGELIVAAVTMDERLDGEAVVTLDGVSIDTSRWCDCSGRGIAVYYEKRPVVNGHVSPTRRGHGYACTECRRLVQTG